MALINCPECNNQVSSNANSCPHCGYAIKSNEQKGKEIKEGLKGLNTVASPKKKKTCLLLNLIPFLAWIVLIIGGVTELDLFVGIGFILWLLSGSVYFYTGHIKKGIIYSVTCGMVIIGSISTFFKLITGTFKDSSGFPVIY